VSGQAANQRTGTTTEPTGRFLGDLVHATYWMDDGLQAHMRACAGMSLPRSQSMLMVYLSDGFDRPADLAKRLRISKQAVQQGLKELIAKDMVTLERDPENRRQKRVRFTDHGRELRDIAQQGLERLEAELSQRIGAERMQALGDALQANWGPGADSTP
jgi:DNA-binding MarR family transcriptional regulator